MLRIAALIALFASPLGAQTTVPQWQGSYSPPEVTVVDESPTDRLMALHAIALSLTNQEMVTWNNSETGNSGHVTIGNRSGRCVDFTNVMIMQGVPTQDETFNACRGGGNDNTWIIDQEWMISSVTRQRTGNCMTRHMNARIDRGRMYSDNAVCRFNNTWNVEG